MVFCVALKNNKFILIVMSVNLANKCFDDRLKVELDKQASFAVWQLKERKVPVSSIRERLESLHSDQEKAWFVESFEFYRTLTGIPWKLSL